MRWNAGPDTFPSAVEQWMTRHRLLSCGEHVVVGVSGGPDSVALLRLLRLLSSKRVLTITVAHIHHGVRGDAADGDQQFVETLAAEHGCRCVTRRLAGTAQDEASLREARYDTLATIAREVGARAVAVGHTLDDHVETVLMRLIRGAGLRGVQGIPVERALGGVRLIRPLRGVWRSDVEAWLRAMGQPWRADATNTEPSFLRNRIRHELLPLLAEYNPQIKLALCHLAETACAAWEYLERQAEAWLDAHGRCATDHLRLPHALWMQEPVALRQAVLRLALRQFQGHLRQLTYQHWLEVEALAHRPVGSIVDLPGGVQLLKTEADLVMRRRHPSALPSRPLLSSCVS